MSNQIRKDQTSHDEYKFLNKSEAAKQLQASVRQVERWTQQGRLGHVRLGLQTLYTPAQIAAFVESCTVNPTA